MESDRNGILRYPLLALKILGRHPKINSKLNAFIAALYLIVLAYLSVVTLLQYSNIKGDIYKFANNFEGSTAYIQVKHVNVVYMEFIVLKLVWAALNTYMSGKVIFTVTHKRQLIELIDEVKYFWTIDRCDGTVRRKLNDLLENTRSILKVFFVCVLATEILIVMAPFFTKDIAVGAWTLENQDFLFHLTLLLQEIVLFFVFTSFTFVLDCVFLVLFIYVIVQYRILNYCLRNINIATVTDEYTKEQYLETLREYVKYHNFLLRYSKKLQITLSPVMLIEYVTTAVLFCTEMYMFIESSSIQESIRRPISFCAVLFQLAFYCIPADFVTGEALAISDALYHSDWTSEYLTISRKSMLFIIQRAQQPINFTAGGLAYIKTGSLLNVVKISWSVCTILRALKNKAN